MLALALTSNAGISTRMPASTATNPSPTTRRGDTSGKNLGTPAAASSIVTDRGVIRRPILTAESPRATER